MVKVIEAQVENNEKKQKNYKPLFITLMSLALVLITVVAAVLAIFVNKFKPRRDDVNVFSCGLVAVRTDEGWGYANKSGKIVIRAQFDEAYAFSNNGLALVSLDGYYGFINTKGKYVVNPIYEDAEPFAFNEDLTAVKRNGKWGYIEEDGEEEIACQFEEAYEFSYDLALVKISGKYGYIDDDGYFVINPTFEYANTFTSNGFAIVGHNTENGKRWACINRRGELLTEYAYHNMGTQYNYTIGFDGTNYVVFNSKMKQLFTTEMEIISVAGQLDRFANIKEGLIPFRNENHKFGYFDLAGKVVIPAEYDVIGNFNNGLALVKKSGKYGFINRKNKMVIENKFVFAEAFSEGYAVIKDNSLYGLINKKGEIVVKCIYSSLGPVKNGVCYFAKSDKTGYGYMTVDGKEIISQQCSAIPAYDNNVYNCSDDGYIVIKQNEFYGIINKSGKFIINSYLRDVNF